MNRTRVVVCLVLVTATAVVVPAVKIITGRTAPGAGFDDVLAGGTEFPSGHAVNVIAGWLLGAAIFTALVGLDPFAPLRVRPQRMRR